MFFMFKITILDFELKFAQKYIELQQKDKKFDET